MKWEGGAIKDNDGVIMAVRHGRGYQVPVGTYKGSAVQNLLQAVQVSERFDLYISFSEALSKLYPDVDVIAVFKEMGNEK